MACAAREGLKRSKRVFTWACGSRLNGLCSPRGFENTHTVYGCFFVVLKTGELGKAIGVKHGEKLIVFAFTACLLSKWLSITQSLLRGCGGDWLSKGV